MHLCQRNGMEIGRAVVYDARAAHIFSAGIKFRHCSYSLLTFSIPLSPITSLAYYSSIHVRGVEGYAVACVTYLTSVSS